MKLAALSLSLAANSFKAAPLPPAASPLPAASLPSLPVPVSGPLSLPGPSFPLPAPAPLELPSAEIHLDWSFLDGRDGAAVAVPTAPAPKPLPPAGAAAPLRFSAEAARKDAPEVRVGPDAFFDQARPRVLVELP